MHVSGLARMIPIPSDAVLVKLAGIAAQVDGMLAAENPLNQERVGIKTVKNDRRRTMEAVLVLLADRDVRAYLGELEGLGVLPPER
jgi:hypothetical protein